jgi:transposase
VGADSSCFLRYAIGMRYAQGGGLTAKRREFRERLRLEAAERFTRGEENAVIAKDLRVSVRSVQRWRRAWRESGIRALASQGPASVPRLSHAQFAQLEAELTKGAAAHGWQDQRWTLARITTLIGRRFHMSFTIQGVRKMLRRHGWSCQVPVRRAIERDDAAVEGWVKETWPRVE